MNWRNRKIPRTLASDGRMAPHQLLTRWSVFISRKSGNIPTCAGMMSAAKSTPKSRSRPPKRSLAKA
jgi:hypothetical protein